jgi:hypothetical protein
VRLSGARGCCGPHAPHEVLLERVEDEALAPMGEAQEEGDGARNGAQGHVAHLPREERRGAAVQRRADGGG